MARRHGIVLDSDDEESDASSGPQAQLIAAEVSRGTESTDPSFFQRVYNEQLNAPPMVSGETEPAIPLTPSQERMRLLGDAHSPIVPNAAGPEVQHIKDLSSMTSITEPRSTRNKAKTGPAETSDLTQITTPRATIATDAVWDVPSSAGQRNLSQPMASASSVKKGKGPAKTYGKRKRTPQSSTSFPSDLPDVQEEEDDESIRASAVITAASRVAEEEGDSPIWPRKRTKRGSPVTAVSEDVLQGGLTVMVEDPATKASRVRREALIGEGSASLVLATSRLTASQKGQYRKIGDSSDADLETAAARLPSTRRSNQKSSGSATVAYTTPSQYASPSRQRGLPSLQESVDNDSKRDIVHDDDQNVSVISLPTKEPRY
jgi:hypothetical protein